MKHQEIHNKAKTRAFDTLASAPGPGAFGQGAPEDEHLVRLVADLYHLQWWRVDKGLSKQSMTSLIQKGVELGVSELAAAFQEKIQDAEKAST